MMLLWVSNAIVNVPNPISSSVTSRNSVVLRSHHVVTTKLANRSKYTLPLGLWGACN